MTDSVDRLEAIRHRNAPNSVSNQARSWKQAAGDRNYLLSLVEDVGEALASLRATEIDGLLDAVEYHADDNADELVETLAQVRDAALKKEYEEEVEG